MPRFAANLTMLFTERPFLDRFEAAARAGFAQVECLFPYAFAPDQIAERLTANNLSLALFNLPPGDWAAGERGIACLAGREAEFRAGLDLALRYTKATGARRLHLMAGLGTREDASTWRRYRAAITEAAQFFAPFDIDVLIEALNPRDMPGYLLNDVDLAADLVREMALPNLRLQFDLYHCQLLHGEVRERLARYLPLIGHIQIAGVPDRQEPDGGALVAGEIAALSDALCYRGIIGAEYRPRGITEAGLGWFAPFASNAGSR